MPALQLDCLLCSLQLQKLVLMHDYCMLCSQHIPSEVLSLEGSVPATHVILNITLVHRLGFLENSFRDLSDRYSSPNVCSNHRLDHGRGMQ